MIPAITVVWLIRRYVSPSMDCVWTPFATTRAVIGACSMELLNTFALTEMLDAAFWTIATIPQCLFATMEKSLEELPLLVVQILVPLLKPVAMEYATIQLHTFVRLLLESLAKCVHSMPRGNPTELVIWLEE
jgi:hypothetical protein